MRKIFISVIIVVLIISTFLFIGCEKDEEKGISSGFNFISNNDVSPSDYCAYKSNVSEFNVV